MKLLIVGHGMIEAKQFACASMELGSTAPSEIQLLLPGKWDGYIDPTIGKKSFEVKPSHIAAAIKYHTERKERSPQRDLVIDYEHQTLKGGEAPAAGWMPNLELRDGKLIATGVKWTAKAKKHIEDGEYRYISPVFAFDVVDKVSGKIVPMAVFNAALTNEPFFDELQPIVSKDNSTLYLFTNKENFMDKLLAKLRAMLGLADGATEDEIIAGMDSMMDKVKGAVAATANILTFQSLVDAVTTFKQSADAIKANYNQVVATLGAKENATPEELKALIVAKADTSGFVAKAEYQKLLDEITGNKVDAVIAKALQQGKISPATKDDMSAWAKRDLEGFEKYIAKVAEYSVVPLNKIETKTDAPGKGGILSETDLLVAKNLGVKVDDLKKTVTPAN